MQNETYQNFLHHHLISMQSFPFVSGRYPDLAKKVGGIVDMDLLVDNHIRLDKITMTKSSVLCNWLVMVYHVNSLHVREPIQD